MRSALTSLYAIVLLCALGHAAHAQDYPLKRLPLLTYLVDYEASWSPLATNPVIYAQASIGLPASRNLARREELRRG